MQPLPLLLSTVLSGLGWRIDATKRVLARASSRKPVDNFGDDAFVVLTGAIDGGMASCVSLAVAIDEALSVRSLRAQGEIDDFLRILL